MTQNANEAKKCCPLQSSQFSHLLVFNLCLKPTFFYPLRMWEAKLIVFKKEIKRLLWYYARLYRGFEVFENEYYQITGNILIEMDFLALVSCVADPPPLFFFFRFVFVLFFPFDNTNYYS